jgi:hypothetical protein
MVHASVVGSIDFTACDQTLRWWTGALFKLQQVEHVLGLKVLELQALRAFGVQSMVDLGQTAEYRQKYAIDAGQTFQAKALPWLGDAKSQNRSSDPLDAIAEWYAVFGKDLTGG